MSSDDEALHQLERHLAVQALHWSLTREIHTLEALAVELINKMMPVAAVEIVNEEILGRRRRLGDLERIISRLGGTE